MKIIILRGAVEGDFPCLTDSTVIEENNLFINYLVK